MAAEAERSQGHGAAAAAAQADVAAPQGPAEDAQHRCLEPKRPAGKPSQPPPSAAARARGRAPDRGEVSFPVMTPEELAPMTVPATADPAELRRVFQEHGVCLVTGVLTQEENAAFEGMWQQDLLSVIEVDKVYKDSVKRQVANLRSQGPGAVPPEWSDYFGSKGMVSQRGLPHGTFAWQARLHPGVRQIFANLFEVTPDELAVGLDNVFWAARGSEVAQTGKEWLHVDQNHRTGFTWPCAQGVLYIWPSEGDRCSTTVVWPGSHRGVYDALMGDPLAVSKGKKPTGHSIKLDELAVEGTRENILARALAESRRVPCPAGSLLLWDSRTVHQGWAGGPRLAQPVCWEPSERRDAIALRRKVWMCAAGVPSSHSSSEGRVHSMARPQRPAATSPLSEVTPSFRPMIVPYTISPEREDEWRAAQDRIWERDGNPRNIANSLQHAPWISALLRPEVLAAL